MAELPIVSGDQCISALERVGYQVAGTKGSHVRMRCLGAGQSPFPDTMS